MPDSTNVFPPGFRLVDTNGAPISGAKIKFFAAGTLTARTVYSTSDLSTTSLGSIVYTDSGGVPVASQGSSTPVMVYTGSTAYKILFTTSADVALFGGAIDNIKGALDTSTFLTTGSTSTLTLPVSSKTSDYTIVAADRGKIINADATGGTFTLTLTSAVTLADNWFTIVRNTGTANPVKIAASQAISGPWASVGSTTSFALRPGEGALIASNGVTFVVPLMAPALLNGTVGVIEITDRVSAAPSSPTPGARYIVSAAFSTYEQEDIIEADGAGSFFEITPPTNCGWIAYVQDEGQYYIFVTSSWVELSATQAQQETGTAVGVFVTPGRQHYHPGHPKAWGIFNTSGALAASYNTTSVTDSGTGDFTVVIATDFSSTSYVVTTGINDSEAIAVRIFNLGAGSFDYDVFATSNGAANDPVTSHFAAFGDQ